MPEHPKFDSSFVFTASIEERVKRLQQRIVVAPHEVSEEDMMVIHKPEKFMAMEAALIDTARMAFHSVIVDTSTLTPDMVVGVINDNFPFSK